MKLWILVDNHVAYHWWRWLRRRWRLQNETAERNRCCRWKERRIGGARGSNTRDTATTNSRHCCFRLLISCSAFDQQQATSSIGQRRRCHDLSPLWLACQYSAWCCAVRVSNENTPRRKKGEARLLSMGCQFQELVHLQHIILLLLYSHSCELTALNSSNSVCCFLTNFYVKMCHFR